MKVNYFVTYSKKSIIIIEPNFMIFPVLENQPHERNSYIAYNFIVNKSILS